MTYLFHKGSLHIGPAQFARAHVLRVLIPSFTVPRITGGLMRRRRRHRRRQRTGGHLEAVRARVVASRRRDVAADVRLLASRLPNLAVRPAVLVGALGGVRRGHVEIQHVLVARLLRLRSQKVVQKIKALRAARSRSGGGRTAGLHGVLQCFRGGSAVFASLSSVAPALFGVIQLMSVTQRDVSLVELVYRLAILVQPAADLRSAGNLTKLPVFPINVSTDARHSRRVGRRLLVARLAARAARLLAEMIALDHGYAHVVRQGGILTDVRAATVSTRARGSPQKCAEGPPLPVLLVRRCGRNRGSVPFPLVRRRHQQAVTHGPLPLVRRRRHRGRPLSLVGG